MKSVQVSIEDVSLNKFHQLLTVRSGGGSFVDGYVLSIIGVVMLQLTSDLNLDSFWEGMIAASALIGIFFGGFIGGWLTDLMGRRLIFFVGPIIFIGASLAQFWAETALTLFLLRLLIGIAVGIEYPVATAMLVEFMPTKYRGPRLAVLGLLWFVGAACAYVVGELILRSGVQDAWRVALASGAVCGALLFLVRMGTPESPRWLLNKGRAGEAEAVIKRVYGPGFSLANPWFQETSSNVINANDLVAFDTDVVSCHGYYSDFSRTFHVGPDKPSEAQRTLYKVAHEQIHRNMSIIHPGMTLKEYSEKAWDIPEKYHANRYYLSSHGCGMTGEYPYLYHRADYPAAGYDGVILSGMTLCVESYIGEEGGKEGVKLEQQILVTETGTELLSMFPFEEVLLN